MDNPPHDLRTLVLAVLLGPAAAAVVVAVAGRLGAGAARRVALALSVLHLAVVGLLAWSAYPELMERSRAVAPGAESPTHFQPFGVPGSPDPSTAHHAAQATTWSVLTLAPGKAGLPGAEVQFYVGLDGLNLWLVALASVMTLVAVLVSWDAVADRAGGYFAWIFVLQTGVIGAFLAFDVLLFYVFFELTLVPTFFLIGYWGVGGGRRDAARKFFLYTLLGGILTLTGIVGTVLTNPTPVVAQPAAEGGEVRYKLAYDAPGEPLKGPATFSLPNLMRNVREWSHRKHAAVEVAAKAVGAARAKGTAAEVEKAEAGLAAAAAARDAHLRLQTWLFVALMAGFAVKIPIVPFHTWLPAAYAEAPTAVTMLLSALLAKLGTFGVLRLVLPLAPDAAFLYGLPLFGFLGALGIVYAALCAFAQRDIKLLTAYSSVSHLGFLVLGLFAMNREGLSGAALHMVNHGLSTGAMFALLAFLVARYRTLDMNQYGGLIARFPAFAFLMFVVSLASIGVPGLNNFVSEMLMLAGLFDPAHTGSMGFGIPVVAAVGILLSAWYTMTMLRRVFFGPLHEPAAVAEPARDVTGREAVAFGIPTVLCVLLGLFPQPLLNTMSYDVGVVAAAADAARERAGYPTHDPMFPK